MKFNPFKERKIMKPYFFLSAFCFLVGNSPAFSAVGNQQPVSPDPPFVVFPKKLAVRLFGTGSNGIMDCALLLSHNWPYPNAQVTGPCNDAETSCLTYGLIRQKNRREGNLGAELAVAARDAQLRLTGCQLAIEATMSNTNSLGESAGYAP
jgi:hypothetical protein